MEESVLLGTKPLVDSIRHFIRDPTCVFSVCHLCESRIVQWRHDSRLLLLLNWFLALRLLFRIKAWRAGLRPSATKKLKSLQKNLKTRTRRRKILFLPLEHKIPIFSQPCNILYIIFISIATDWYVMLIVCTCQWPARKLMLLWSLGTFFSGYVLFYLFSLVVFHGISVNIVNVIFCKYWVHNNKRSESEIYKERLTRYTR